MIRHPYEDLHREYEAWVANCRPLASRVDEIDKVARRLTQPGPLSHYAEVRDRIGVPAVVQAAICERESGNDFTKNPAQGDPWNRASIHVPKNRGPFRSWVDAAVDAFHDCDRLDVNSAPWSLPYACWKWEGYNGLGYRAHGVRSPYVVGGTNLQQRGKYVADGVFDQSHMDGQLGTLPVALRMIELVPPLAFGDAVAIASLPIVQAPPVQPLPVSVGGSLTGVRWVQSSLNLILRPDPPLLVDGSYGRATRAAARRLQIEEGMSQTGLVDDLLCNAIDRRLAAMRPVT